MLSTRIYIIVLPVILVILIIYSAQKELYHVVQVNNPSLNDYERLINDYPNTLSCPCSHLHVPYSAFVTLVPILHEVCSSDFISDEWLRLLYNDDASSYFALDMRAIGNAQFKLLRMLCQSSQEAIGNAFKARFASETLVHSHGTLLTNESVRTQVNVFIDSFIRNIRSEERRRRALVGAFFNRNFLVSGLKTAAIPFIDSDFKFQMVTATYRMIHFHEAALRFTFCQCDATYECSGRLGFFLDSAYELNEPYSLQTFATAYDYLVNGFRGGCLPLNSLLQSTLECYMNQSCLDHTLSYITTFDSTFNILNTSALKQMTLIDQLFDELMVQEWFKKINYSQYFTACHSLSCSYSYTERFSSLYVITTLLGLFGGLTATLRFICPRLVNGYYLIKQHQFCRRRANVNVQPIVNHLSLREQVGKFYNKARNIIRNFNVFTHKSSNTDALREEILSTRLYIGCLIGFTITLVLMTGFDQRMVTTVVHIPTLDDFENLFQTDKVIRYCPCSQIATPRLKFIDLFPIFHHVCSSDLISEDWRDRLSYPQLQRPIYYYLDIRSYGLDMFRTILSLCTLANDTVLDGIDNFLTSKLVSTQVLSRTEFIQQVETSMIDFQTSIQYTFKQIFDFVTKITRGNQLLTSKVSNYFVHENVDTSGRLIQLDIYLGVKSNITDGIPTCSCVLDTCNKPLGFFNKTRNGQMIHLLAEIPGIYSACYPLDGLRFSTLECWFNQTCIDLLYSHLEPFPVEIRIRPLNQSKLIRFTPMTALGNIIDQVMIEQWINITDYEAYYNSCKPLTCTYTYFRRLDLVYTITVLTAVFGGLTVALKIACPFAIKVYMRFRRNNKVERLNSPPLSIANIVSKINIQIRNLVLTLNLFDSESPYTHIQYREIISTRLYVILLSTVIIFLSVYLLFIANYRTKTIVLPSSTIVTQLWDKYSTTLSCPCEQISMHYSTFLSFEIDKYHPICSSEYVSNSYLRTLMNTNLIVIPESIAYKRQFLAGQLYILAELCQIAIETTNASLSYFLRQQFITTQVLTLRQFRGQLEATIDRLNLEISLSLRHSLNYLEDVTHGNSIMSSYGSNWKFSESYTSGSSIIRTRSISYNNCSCAISSNCMVPLTIDNVTFRGLFIGCLPSSVLLQSTLECFFNQTCLDDLHSFLFENVSIQAISLTPLSSTNFPLNATIGSIFDKLFVENFYQHYNYEAFFRTCFVSKCTYRYILKPDILYTLTTIVGLFGGLTVVLRLICPIIINGYILLTKSIFIKDSSINQGTTIYAETSIDSNQAIADKQNVGVKVNGCPFGYCWKNYNYSKKIIIITISISLLIIIVVGISVVLKRLRTRKENHLITAETSNSSISTTIDIPSFNQTTNANVPICSERALWSSHGRTIAGFANGTSSSSFSGLYGPRDVIIDIIGNMYILDTSNSRILFWPYNSTEGRIVAGTGIVGVNSNQFMFPISFTVGNDRLYISDIVNTKISSFPFTEEAGSPDGDTIIYYYVPNTNRAFPVMVHGIAFDHVRSLLYLGDIGNRRLLILNVSDDHITIIVDEPLFNVNTSTYIRPNSILVNETSGSFYVGDSNLHNVFKFEFGSTTGIVVAGNIISRSITNELKSPGYMTLDASGYLYIADTQYNRIVQLVNENGDLRTIAGTGFAGSSSTRLYGPSAVKFDTQQNMYVVDTNNNRIQRFDLIYNGC